MRNSIQVVCPLVALALVAGAAISSASSGAIAESGWEWVNPTPQGYDLYAVAAGDGVLVAVGDGGSIIASTDGIRSKVANGGTDYVLYEVIWANHQFLAVGAKREGFEFVFGVILTSADGFHWVERHRISYSPLGAVAWDGERFVVITSGATFTSGATLLLSTNGEVWAEESLGEEISGLVDLLWDGSRFVAIGATSDETMSAFTSEDALTWQSQPFGCECYPSAIAWGSGRFVVVGGTPGGDGVILTSNEASTWEAQFPEGTGRFQDVIFEEGSFLAVGDDGLVASSPNGYAWSFQDPPTDIDLRGLTKTGAGFWAVGDGGLMMTSLDGTSWLILNEDTLELPHFYEILEMATRDGVVIGVGTNSLIVRSENGGAWEKRPRWVVGYYNSVCWIGSVFWAVGDYGIARSPDGLEWELMLYDTSVGLYDVAWNGSVYVAVGWNPAPGAGDGLVATSADGFDWAYQWIHAGGPLTAVRWTGSLFVAVGVDGILLTSPDGSIWSQYYLDEQINLYDMEWNGDRLVAVGMHWETGRLILSSADGVNWVECLSHDRRRSFFKDVAWVGDRFLAVGSLLGDTVFTSNDGLNWSMETTGIGITSGSVGGDERTIYVTGRGGMIIRRSDPPHPPHPPAPRRPGRRVIPSQAAGENPHGTDAGRHREGLLRGEDFDRRVGDLE